MKSIPTLYGWAGDMRIGNYEDKSGPPRQRTGKTRIAMLENSLLKMLGYGWKLNA